eukprot:TRINITY_DN3659_c2_g1_i4.p1 TRINITY_DN3659_c2_g1~~TRINITY_DN3659_c2_g1_i4.p1  ORF type:complete len:323 (+),score=-6.72 TRINITY_DN3659_c2_g1_i4:86-970(+)
MVVETAIFGDAFKAGFRWNSSALIWTYICLSLPLSQLIIMNTAPNIYKKQRQRIVFIHKILYPIAISNSARTGRLFEPRSAANALANLLEVSGIFPLLAHGIFFIVPFSQHVQLQLVAIVWFFFNVKPVCDTSLPADVFKQIINVILRALNNFHSYSTALITLQSYAIALEEYNSCLALIVTLQFVVGIFVTSAIVFHLEQVSRLKFLENYLRQLQQQQQVEGTSSDADNNGIIYNGPILRWLGYWKDLGLFQDSWTSLFLYYSLVILFSILCVWSFVSLLFLQFSPTKSQLEL